MKKFLPALTFALALALCFACTACGSTQQNDEHQHTYETSWSFDAEKHWHAANCGHDVRKDEAAHTPQNGKCTVCGYRTESISLADFVATYSAQGKAFAENSQKSNFKAELLDEFIYFKANEKDELVSFTILYTGTKSATATQNAKSHEVYLLTATISPVDLDDIADGTVKQTAVSSNSDMAVLTYERASQPAQTALADAVVEACVDFSDAAEGSHFLRLVSSYGYKDGAHSLRVMDVSENGWIQYVLSVKADENADDAALIEALKTKENCSDIKTVVRDCGTLVYRNLAE